MCLDLVLELAVILVPDFLFLFLPVLPVFAKGFSCYCCTVVVVVALVVLAAVDWLNGSIRSTKVIIIWAPNTGHNQYFHNFSASKVKGLGEWVSLYYYCCCCWSLLIQSYSPLARADSVIVFFMQFEWVTVAFTEGAFLNIHWSGVLAAILFDCYMAGATWNCCRLGAVRSVHGTPWNHAPLTCHVTCKAATNLGYTHVSL